jgi:hypothetical protein
MYDFWDCCCEAFCLGAILGTILVICHYSYSIRVYRTSIAEEIPAKLVNINFIPSRYVYRYTESQKFITIWDTKEYGRLKSEKEVVWQYAEPESILLVKQWNGRPYIDNIKTH